MKTLHLLTSQTATLDELFALKVHPLAELFPPAGDEIVHAIAADMAARGFRPSRPIVLLDGKILDGRNRRDAALWGSKVADNADITAYTIEFEKTTEQSPLDFVLSENLHRRHLTTSQRAIVAANLASWQVGMNQFDKEAANLPTQKEIGKSLSISGRAIRMAKAVRNRSGELEKAVTSGKLTVSTAESLIGLGDKELADTLILERRQIVARAKEIRAENSAVSRVGKMDNLNKIAAQGQNTSGKVATGKMPVASFPIIYADNPWKNEVWGKETGVEKDPPYPCMEIEEMMALCAGEKSPATKDAILFFWRKANNQLEAIKVVQAWGFEPVSEVIWDKVKIGMGRWVRDRHEVLMICKRGDIPAPVPGQQWASLYSEPRTVHSRKPAWFASQITKQYPDLPKLELFQRKVSLNKGDCRLVKENGWAFWGNESGGEG